MSRKASTIKARKAKGRRLQQWVAEQISSILGIPYGKDSDIESREMGQSGTDIKLYGEAQERFKYSVECKSAERWDIHNSIKQAKSNQKKDTDWLLIMKRSREEPVAILSAEAFFRLYRRFYHAVYKKRR